MDEVEIKIYIDTIAEFCRIKGLQATRTEDGALLVKPETGKSEG